MRAQWLLIFPLALIAQSDSTLTRDRGYWVQDSTGTISASTLSRLKIDTRGAVELRGVDGTDSISYTIRKRVSAHAEIQAQRILSQFGIKTRNQGDWTILTVMYPPDRAVSADLRVTAPRRVIESVLETYNGHVQIMDVAGSVTAQTMGGRIECDGIGASVVARTGGGEIVLGRINGAVRCLSGGGSIRLNSAAGEASFETAGGEIYVREVRGPLRASTAGGNIRIDHASSTVNVQTAGGLIDVQHAGGVVTAETNGGSIQVGGAQGVRCESGNGAIRLRGVAGAMRASTAIGSILAALTAGPLQDSFLNTGAGDVTVFFPSNLRVTVKARNETGGAARIISDFPEISVRRLEPPRTAVAEGALNGGGPLLQISAIGGTIYLRRQR